MTKPQSTSATIRSGEPEKESGAAQVRTATDHNDTKVQSTTPVATETKDLTAAEDSKEAEDATRDDPQADTNSHILELAPAVTKLRVSGRWLLAYGLLPGLALLLAVAAAYLKDQVGLASESGIARIESVAAAKESTIALLSYKPETAEKDLGAVRDRTTGTFKESYTQLTHDVVIPGAKEKHISAVAKVPAAASVSATPNHAVALVFIDQTVVMGTDQPTDTTSSVRVTLDKIGGRWLISGFDPV
jgi:Mce-associated membrane protein